MKIWTIEFIGLKIIDAKNFKWGYKEINLNKKKRKIEIIKTSQKEKYVKWNEGRKEKSEIWWRKYG